jgi:hypothetical protein
MVAPATAAIPEAILIMLPTILLRARGTAKFIIVVVDTSLIPVNLDNFTVIVLGAIVMIEVLAIILFHTPLSSTTGFCYFAR